MRRMIVLVAATLFPAALAAQDPYPVTVGLGGGILNGRWDTYHALVVVGIAAPRFPVSLRLDGLIDPNNDPRVNTDLLAAVSASAVITLRPWRVAPYLIVGATRTSEYDIPPVPELGFPSYHSPARTQLTGGLGLGMRVGRARLFGEMRELQHAGSPLTIGVTF